MTATVSTNTAAYVKAVNPPLHNWKHGVKSEFKLMIVLLILHVFAMPAVMLAEIIGIYTDAHNIGAYEAIACITTALGGFLGIFPAVNSFSCLHNRSVVDMKLSLPMNSRQRFISNYLSGLFAYTAPFLAAQSLSLVLFGYAFAFMEGRTFYHIERIYDSYRDITVTEKVPYVCNEFSEAFPAYLKLFLCGILVMIMLYSITVLVTVCCGNKFECIAYTILINIVIPLTELCAANSIFDGLFGVEIEEPFYRIMMYTSPAGGLIAAVDMASGGGALTGTYLTNYVLWTFSYLLTSAVITAVAYFLYGRRRAEQVSKPFVFKLIRIMLIVRQSSFKTDAVSGTAPCNFRGVVYI